MIVPVRKMETLHILSNVPWRAGNLGDPRDVPLDNGNAADSSWNTTFLLVKAEFFPEVMFALGKTNFDTIMFINSSGCPKSFTSVRWPSTKLPAFPVCTEGNEGKTSEWWGSKEMKQNGIFYCLYLNMKIYFFSWNCSFLSHSAPFRLAMKENVLFRTDWRRVFLLRPFSKVLPILGQLINLSFYLAEKADPFSPPVSSWKCFRGEPIQKQGLCSFQLQIPNSNMPG